MRAAKRIERTVSGENVAIPLVLQVDEGVWKISELRPSSVRIEHWVRVGLIADGDSGIR